MGVIIPGNADPTLAIDTILIGFTRMAASKCAVPPHLQAMILVSKLPYQMSAFVQSICQTDNIEDLKTNDIKRKAILAWEQRGPTQNNRPQQPQAAVAGVCADLLLSYQRNSVGIDGNGGDEGGSRGF